MTLGIVESGRGVVDSDGTIGKLQNSSLYELSGGSTRDHTMGEVITGVSASTEVSVADSGEMAARDLSFGATAVGVYDLSKGWPTVDPTIAGVITGDSSSRGGSAADSGGRGRKLVSDSSGDRGGMVVGSPCSRGQTANFWVIFLRGGPNDHDASTPIPRKWSLLTSFYGGKEKNQRLNGSPERNADPGIASPIRTSLSERCHYSGYGRLHQLSFNMQELAKGCKRLQTARTVTNDPIVAWAA